MLESVLYSQHDLMNIVSVVVSIFTVISIVGVSQRGLPAFQEGISDPDAARIVFSMSVIPVFIANTGLFVKIDRAIKINIEVTNIVESDGVTNRNGFLVVGIPTQTITSINIQ